MSKFSVITINLNNGKGLKKTIESVVNQTSNIFEYLVIDGGSIDDSLDLIKQLDNNKIQRFKWISEPDKGIYNAMNKGIQMSTGEYLLFLNSGDEFANDLVLELVNGVLEDNTDICSGILNMIDTENVLIKQPLAELSLYHCFYGGLTHPNTFIRKRLFDKYGLYNESNKIVSDWEFFLLVAGLHQINYQAISVPITNFYLDGISSDPNNPIALEETKRVIENLIPSTIVKDLERLSMLEGRMNQINFKTVEYLMEKHSSIAKIIFFPFTILYYILKKRNKLNF
jgi:glycosyltransferase involved in cell wall biosynthesis